METPPFLTPENERAENFTFRYDLGCFKNFKMADKSFSQPIFTKLWAESIDVA